MRDAIRAAAKSSAATLNWRAVLNDPRQSIVLTNSTAQAMRLCREGVPAIAVLGISAADLTTWLRAKGARVITKGSAH